MINHIHIPTQLPTSIDEVIPPGTRILYPIPVESVTEYKNGSTSDLGTPEIPSDFLKIPDGWKCVTPNKTVQPVQRLNEDILKKSFVVNHSNNKTLSSFITSSADDTSIITFTANVNINRIYTKYSSWIIGSDYLMIDENNNYDIKYAHYDPAEGNPATFLSGNERKYFIVYYIFIYIIW